MFRLDWLTEVCFTFILISFNPIFRSNQNQSLNSFQVFVEEKMGGVVRVDIFRIDTKIEI